MNSSLRFSVCHERRLVTLEPNPAFLENAAAPAGGVGNIEAIALRALILKFAGDIPIPPDANIPPDLLKEAERNARLGYDPAYCGLSVSGDLHLDSVELFRSLRMEGCDFDGAVYLRHIVSRTVSLRGSRLIELNASEAEIHGSLLLSERTGISDHAVVRGSGAADHGDAPFESRKLIDLSLANVTGDVVLSGAEIGCALDGSVAGSLAEGCALMAGGLKANALWIDGSTVKGRVFLAGAVMKTMLSIRHTEIALPVDASKLAAAPASRNRAPHPDILPGRPEFKFVALAANDMTLGTKLYIQNCRILGQARLSRAKIGGDCLFQDTLFCSSYIALKNKLESIGASNVEQTTVAYLAAAGINDDSHDMASLHASRADIGGGVFMHAAISYGELRFRNTRIRGVLNARGALLVSLRSLQLSQVDYDEIKSLRRPSAGNRPKAGSLSREASGDRGPFPRPGVLLSGITLCADRADINSSVFLARYNERNSAGDALLFESFGEVSMRQTRIGGSLNCRHAQMVAAAVPKEGDAPDLGVNEIGQKHFVAMALSGSDIGGTVFLSGDTSARCFRSEGEIRLRGANIKGNIIFYNGQFTHVPIHLYYSDKRLIKTFYENRSILNLRTAVVAGTIFFAPDKELFDKQASAGIQGDKSAVVRGGIDFHLAECAALQDSVQSWPFSDYKPPLSQPFRRLNSGARKHPAAWLRLDGFKYRLLSGPISGWSERKKWLKMSRSAFTSSSGGKNANSLQPYEHLASVLKSQGFVHDACLVLYRRGELAWSPASRHRRTIVHRIGHVVELPLLAFVNAFRWISYFPQWGVLAIFAVMTAVTFISHEFYRLGLMRPAEEEVIIGEDYAEYGEVPLEMRFNAITYTIDLVVPGLDFRQERYWMPKVGISSGDQPVTPVETPEHIVFRENQSLKASDRNRIDFYNRRRIPYFVELFARLSGWILFSVTILGYTGVLRPDRDV